MAESRRAYQQSCNLLLVRTTDRSTDSDARIHRFSCVLRHSREFSLVDRTNSQPSLHLENMGAFPHWVFVGWGCESLIAWPHAILVGTTWNLLHTPHANDCRQNTRLGGQPWLGGLAASVPDAVPVIPNQPIIYSRSLTSNQNSSVLELTAHRVTCTGCP